MTVSTTTITSGPYSGAGTTDTFSYTFRVENKTQLKVYETDDAAVQTLLTVDTDYTVNNIGTDGGGTITRVAGNLPLNYEWYIRSDYKLTQLTEFASQGSFLPEIHEAAMDKMTFLIQQQQDGIDRNFRLSDAIPVDGTFTIAQDAATRANLALGFDASGDLVPAAFFDPTLINQTDLDQRHDVTFATVAAMVAASPVDVAGNAVTPQVGATLRTQGYYTAGDGGGNSYLVVAAATGTADGGSFLDLTSHQAQGVFNHGWVNVKAFGAKGDNVTDDVLNVQAGINYLESLNGGTLYFPRSNYVMSTVITVEKGGIALMGDAVGGTHFKFSSATGNSVVFDGTAVGGTGILGCLMQDIFIEHTATKSAGSAVRLFKVNESKLVNVNIGQAWNSAEFEVVNNIIVDRCVFSGSLGAWGVKFHASSDASTRSDVLTMHDTAINMGTIGDGIHWDGLAHTLRLGNVGLINCVNGIRIMNTGATANAPAFLFADGLEIDGTTAKAVSIEAGSQFHITNSDMFCLSSATGPVVDIALDASTLTNAVHISNSRVMGGLSNALQSAGRDLKLTNNFIGGGSGAVPAIKLLAAAHDNIIVGNEIGRSWGTPTVHTYGIEIQAGVNRTYIDSNSYYLCATGEILDNSATGTVWLGFGLDIAGVPKMLNSETVFRNDTSGVATILKVLNNTSAGNSDARIDLVTGTSNSSAFYSLKDNAGSPFSHLAFGSAVSTHFVDVAEHQFRNVAATKLMTMKTTGAINFEPLAAAPAGAVAGDTYYDSTLNKHRGYDGTIWNNFY